MFFIILIFIFNFTFPINGKFDINFTLRSLHGRLSDTTTPSLIHCISSTGNPEKITFSRLLDTGQGNKLPGYSQQFLQGVPIFARILYMPNEDTSSNFGAFQCQILNRGISTTVTTLKLPPLSKVEIDAEEPYISLSVGDDVEINMIKYVNHSLDILWKHNDEEKPEWKNQLRVKIKNVKPSDEGIYECYFNGRRSEGVHGILRLIVRACPVGKFGALCNQDCPPCYNGGLCHDNLGECVCPSGFIGSNCEKACGANFFGEKCEKQCFLPAQEGGCASHIFCKPDPYGCSCAPGYKGVSCEDSCEPGSYGANCKQVCHCLNGSSACNKITGACDGGCSSGWKGNSCQIPDDTILAVPPKVICKLGTFGKDCKQKCHCFGKASCDSVLGTCPGECESGWNSTSCNECIEGKFGENCENMCHCNGGNENCETDGKCSFGCEAGWTGFTCQQECTSGRFGSNCGSSCHCLNGPTACNKITGSCSGDCQAGFMESDCQTTCPVNKFGVNCQESCECHNGGICNRVNGNCTCGGFWRGQKCSDRVPQIIATSQNEINVRQYSVISCTADAIPPPSLEITSSDLNRLNTTVTEFAINQYQATANVTANSAGNLTFHCTTNNTYGWDMKSFSLLVIDPPKLKESPTVLKVTSNSIEISWKSWKYGEDYGGREMDKVDYRVVFRIWETTIWNKTKNWLSVTNAVIYGLLPDTGYQIAVECRRPGNGGEGVPSPIISNRTLCGNPSHHAVPLDFQPKHFTPHSVTVTWKPPIYSELQCSLIGYTLRYYEGIDVHNVQHINISKTEESYTVEGLMPDTDYVLNLFVVTPKGMGQQFATLNFSTPETVPGPVKNLKFSQIPMYPGLIKVEWEASSITNGILKDYLIKYELIKQGLCENVLSSNSQGKEIISESKKEIILQGLLPFSTYKVSVQASTSAGFGKAESIFAETLESVPFSSPQNIRVVLLNKTELIFEWDPVACDTANGIINSYEYGLQNASEIKKDYRQKREANEFKQWIKPLTQVLDTKTVITGLIPFEEYAFKVRALTKLGSGPFSEWIYARTTEDVPSSPLPRISFISENKLTVKWGIPNPSHGVIIKYRLHIWQNVKKSDVQTRFVNNNGNEESHYNFQNLEPFTKYSIQVQAATQKGWGNWSEVVSVVTEEYYPGSPSKINVIMHSNFSITVFWSPPIKLNGILIGYKVSCQPVSSLEFDIDKLNLIEHEFDNTTVQATFENLHLNTEYNFTVRASTTRGFGDPISTNFWTSVTGTVSSIVEIMDNKTLTDAIKIKFSSGHSGIIKYQIIVEDARNKEGINEQQLADHESATLAKLPYYITAELNAKDLKSKDDYYYFVIGDQKNYGVYKNVHLSPGVLYNIRIRTISTKMQSYISEARQHVIVGYQNNDDYEKPVFGLTRLNFIFVLIGIIVLLIIIIFVIGLAFHRHRQNKDKKKKCFTIHDPHVSDAATWSVAYKVSDYEAVDSPIVKSEKTIPSFSYKGSLLQTKKLKKEICNESVHVDDLADYIHNKNIHPSKNFSEEFQQLPRGQCSQWSVAKKSENIAKNRYGNLLPYDKNRVILQIIPNVSPSDYINASYINGYNRSREYIATQGPKEGTISDFWRMVWQENSSVIVMVTGLIENGKNKCSKYWPDYSICYGNLQILLSHTESCIDFIIRTILIRKISTGETQRVKHYQFLDWPDHKIPTSASSLLILIKRMRSESLNPERPIIVHCSAGIGRSGTFIVIDVLLQQVEREKEVNILSVVQKMRSQRIDMVQNLEQYIFIHETLLEAIQFGNTAVMADELPIYVKNMCVVKPNKKISELENQFQILEKIKKKIDVRNCSEALTEINIFKNRDPMIVPDNQKIIKLKSLNLTYENNYINAITVDGYKHKNSFLVTQMPLPHTVVDFWKMVYDYNSSLIVMLNDGEKKENDLFVGQYWPSEAHAHYNFYEVQVVTFEDHGTVIIRTIKLINSRNSNEAPHRIVQLQYKEWPHDQILPTSASMLALLNQVDRWYRGTTGGPITVHCMNGAERCGMFCVASYICDQLKTEHTVDVFNAVKKLRINRPEFISSLEQYKFCYELALELIDSYLSYRFN